MKTNFFFEQTFGSVVSALTPRRPIEMKILVEFRLHIRAVISLVTAIKKSEHSVSSAQLLSAFHYGLLFVTKTVGYHMPSIHANNHNLFGVYNL